MNKFVEQGYLRASQWRIYRHWLALILAAEILMLIFNQYLVGIYLGISALFLGAGVFRMVGLYPGEGEPLILDFSAVILALMFAVFAYYGAHTPWRFFIILCSSLIVVPHFIYIIRYK